VFLAAADVTISFADNLANLPGCYDRQNLVCFEMSSTEIPTVQRVLYEANVTEATLFPGLDGFAVPVAQRRVS
jgi:hypothetical protein